MLENVCCAFSPGTTDYPESPRMMKVVKGLSLMRHYDAMERPEKKTRGHENVGPTIIERPHVYILGRCGSKEIEQLAYVDTRQECLDHLSTM